MDHRRLGREAPGDAERAHSARSSRGNREGHRRPRLRRCRQGQLQRVRHQSSFDPARKAYTLHAHAMGMVGTSLVHAERLGLRVGDPRPGRRPFRYTRVIRTAVARESASGSPPPRGATQFFEMNLVGCATPTGPAAGRGDREVDGGVRHANGREGRSRGRLLTRGKLPRPGRCPLRLTGSCRPSCSTATRWSLASNSMRAMRSTLATYGRWCPRSRAFR